LDKARDPVLAYSNARECPVCKGEVTETGIIPIYGNSSADGSCESGLKDLD